jgi:Calcineurin-like phosphoesterase
VTYSETQPLWYLPWLWYDFFKIDPETGAVVHFIVTDSCSIIFRKNDPDRQLAWIESVLATSQADWKIFVTHYPAYSSGNYAPGTVTIRDEFFPLFEKYGVDMLLTGHDHNMQHITTLNGATDYVISGGGGRRLYEYSPAGERVLNSWNVTLDYFGYHFGFVDMQLTKTTMDVKIVDADANVRYSFSRTK